MERDNEMSSLHSKSALLCFTLTASPRTAQFAPTRGVTTYKAGQRQLTYLVCCSMNKTHKLMACELCECIFEGDMALTRRYIKAGVDINVGDFDQRTALHIAAAEANPPAVNPAANQSMSLLL